jgi:elongation factor G
MDRSGADFFNVVKQIRERLGANPVPLQVPIGAEADFKGVVDLINNRGMVWNEADQGMTWSEVPIPEDLKDTVKEWRDKLIEAVAESDDKLMEKYFADPDSLTEAEVMNAVRKSTINMSITPRSCAVAPSRTRVCRPCSTR